MAAPFAFYDELCDQGWPALLSPAALRLLLHVARRVDRKSHATRISFARLQVEAVLPHRTFHRAKRELFGHGLLQRSKVRGRRTPTLVIVLPVPAMASMGAKNGTLKCQPWHSRVPTVAPTNGQEPLRTRVPGRKQQEIKASTRGQTEEPAGVRGHLERQEVPGPFMDAFVVAAQAVRGFEAGPVREAALDDSARDLSRRMQAQGVRWPETRVRELLAAAMSVGHPLVQAAARIFGGAEVVEVRAARW
jgi:hypothetical protein